MCLAHAHRVVREVDIAVVAYINTSVSILPPSHGLLDWFHRGDVALRPSRRQVDMAQLRRSRGEGNLQKSAVTVSLQIQVLMN
jgi:hypothetical protein